MCVCFGSVYQTFQSGGANLAGALALHPSPSEGATHAGTLDQLGLTGLRTWAVSWDRRLMYEVGGCHA